MRSHTITTATGRRLVIGVSERLTGRARLELLTISSASVELSEPELLTAIGALTSVYAEICGAGPDLARSLIRTLLDAARRDDDAPISRARFEELMRDHGFPGYGPRDTAP